MENNIMIIAIDDSGDPGFKFGKGSSDFFVISGILFKSKQSAEQAKNRVREIKRELKWRQEREFKFHRTSEKAKEYFFGKINDLEFKAILAVVNKHDVPEVPPDILYNETILKVVKTISTKGSLIVYIDGEGGKKYRKRVKTYFRQNLPKNKLRTLRYKNSAVEELIQIADMVAGATLRANAQGNDKLLSLIKSHISRTK